MSCPAIYTVLLLGASGETGKQLLKQLAASQNVGKVVSLGRREIPVEGEGIDKVDQRIIDFDNMDKHVTEFKDIHKAFCTLGTTRAKAGKEGFVKVDHDYVLKAAQLLKSEGCEEFHLLTSKGSNPNSWFLYPETKGKIEEAVKDLNFTSAYIYRPGLLLCEREEERMGEKFARWLAGLIDKSLKWSVPVESVARSMVVSSEKSTPGVHVLEHEHIVNAAKSQE
eukprot:TRINITY_DN23367_c0_g1_i1.p1 TRINITY_DN23367_c0_g1~~TRINITY_DN23367_c0_g1_i1.p1  ORF type:complete len:224 (+),score=68.17 TRINITY_DN23367_c0_g1_i1:130-801(+)